MVFGLPPNIYNAHFAACWQTALPHPGPLALTLTQCTVRRSSLHARAAVISGFHNPFCTSVNDQNQTVVLLLQENVHFKGNMHAFCIGQGRQARNTKQSRQQAGNRSATIADQN